MFGTSVRVGVWTMTSAHASVINSTLFTVWEQYMVCTPACTWPGVYMDGYVHGRVRTWPGPIYTGHVLPLTLYTAIDPVYGH